MVDFKGLVILATRHDQGQCHSVFYSHGVPVSIYIRLIHSELCGAMISLAEVWSLKYLCELPYFWSNKLKHVK